MIKKSPKSKRAATKKSVLDKAKPVSKLQTVISALLYGRSGTGKTTLAGTFPKPVLFIDVFERGTDSVADQDEIDSIAISEWYEFEEIYWELKEQPDRYKTVVIDAVHTLQALAITEKKIEAGKKDEDQTSQRDFGQAAALLSTWIRNYRDLIDLGVQVVFLCHDKITEVDTDDDTDGMINPEVGPRVMPSVAGALLGSVNVVGNTFIREEVTKSRKAGQKPTRKVEYCLRIGPNSYYATKVRRPKNFAIPEYIVDPTYDKLVNVIQGKSESSNKPLTRKIVRRK